jgi:hypothetical protein
VRSARFVQSLFHVRRPSRGHDELERIAAGKKGMSLLTSMPREQRFPQIDALMIRALDLGLLVVVVPDRDQPHIAHLFATTADQLWRVPAYETMWQQPWFDRWLPHADAMMSRLLGYTEAQRRRFYPAMHQVGWIGCGPRSFAVVSAAQQRAIADTGHHGFAPHAFPSGLDVFHLAHSSQPRRTAGRQLAGDILVRFAVQSPGAYQLIGMSPKRPSRHRLRADELPQLNAELTCRIEAWTGSRWR